MTASLRLVNNSMVDLQPYILYEFIRDTNVVHGPKTPLFAPPVDARSNGLVIRPRWMIIP